MNSDEVAELLHRTRPPKLLDMIEEGPAARFQQWRKICEEFERHFMKNSPRFDKREFFMKCDYF